MTWEQSREMRAQDTKVCLAQKTKVREHREKKVIEEEIVTGKTLSCKISFNI